MICPSLLGEVDDVLTAVRFQGQALPNLLWWGGGGLSTCWGDIAEADLWKE